jgi:hypothetical protein
VAVEEGSMESGWAKLPEQLLTKVKKALQAAEQCAPQDGGRCKASATVRLVCSGWNCRHTRLVMRLLLRQAATDERACWCGGGSLDLKARFNALTNEALRVLVVSSLTALASLELWGSSTGDGREDARRALARTRTTH